MKSKIERQIYWSDHKEVISSNKPLLVLFKIIKVMPDWFLTGLVNCVAFFYLISSKRARIECRTYQKQLYEYSEGKEPVKSSAYKQIRSFCLCVIEKMQGWLGKCKYDKIICHEDDMQELLHRLEKGKGAFLIGSHLGNIELLRGLSSFGENGINKNISVTTIMEKNATAVFNKTIMEINPNAGFQVIDPSEINPDTIIALQERIENGGLVVVAADRPSANSRNRVIRKKFLGKEADFPYGVFVLASLLKVPTYYVFGLRDKESSLNSRYHMCIEKSAVDLNCGRAEREEKLKDLCDEFVGKLEKYCMKFPYQWYNFYNFWLQQDGNNG